MDMSAQNQPTGSDVEDAKKEPTSGADSEGAYYTAPPGREEQDFGEKAPEFVNDAPDGGTAAWLCVLGAWCTSFCSFGWLNSMSLFYNCLESQFVH
jgi:hypothetical protein